MKTFCILGLAAVLASPAAFAAGDMPKGSVSGYLTMTDVDVGGFTDDGTGIGIRGWAQISGMFFAHGEFQTSSLDNSDVDQLRVGGGVIGSINPSAMWLAKAEFISIGNDFSDQSGIGVHGGAMFMPAPAVDLFGTVGYLTTDDTDGIEINVGGGYAFSRMLGGFIDYRTYMGSVDPNGDFEVSDIHVGVSMKF